MPFVLRCQLSQSYPLSTERLHNVLLRRYRVIKITSIVASLQAVAAALLQFLSALKLNSTVIITIHWICSTTSMSKSILTLQHALSVINLQCSMDLKFYRASIIHSGTSCDICLWWFSFESASFVTNLQTTKNPEIAVILIGLTLDLVPRNEIWQLQSIRWRCKWQGSKLSSIRKRVYGVWCWEAACVQMNIASDGWKNKDLIMSYLFITSLLQLQQLAVVRASSTAMHPERCISHNVLILIPWCIFHATLIYQMSVIWDHKKRICAL